MDSSGEMNMLDKQMTQFETNSVTFKLRKYYESNATEEHENNKVDKVTDLDEISQSDNTSLNKTVAIPQPANVQILAAEIESVKDSDKCPTSLEHKSVYNKNGNDGSSEKKAFDTTDVAAGGSSYRVERMGDIYGNYVHFCVVPIPLVKS